MPQRTDSLCPCSALKGETVPDSLPVLYHLSHEGGMGANSIMNMTLAGIQHTGMQYTPLVMKTWGPPVEKEVPTITQDCPSQTIT